MFLNPATCGGRPCAQPLGDLVGLDARGGAAGRGRGRDADRQLVGRDVGRRAREADQLPVVQVGVRRRVCVGEAAHVHGRAEHAVSARERERQRRAGHGGGARDARGLVVRLDVEEARGRAAAVGTDRVGERVGALDDGVARGRDDRLALELGAGPHAVLGEVGGERLLVEHRLALLHTDAAGLGIFDRAPDAEAQGLDLCALFVGHVRVQDDRAVVLDALVLREVVARNQRVDLGLAVDEDLDERPVRRRRRWRPEPYRPPRIQMLWLQAPAASFSQPWADPP